MKWLCLAGAAAMLLPVLHAQYAPPPDAYSLTGVNGMMGVPVSTKVYRDGSRALVESSAPNTHTFTLYDLKAHSAVSWSPDNGSVGCSKSTFSGDWGDPFAMSAELNKQAATMGARQAGTETVNGFTTKVLEAATPDGSTAKAWIESKYGLVVKMVLAPKTGEPRTIIEVQSFTPGKPPAATFNLPADCAAAAAAPNPPTAQEKIAMVTGGNAADYAQAIMPPPSPNGCDVQLRVVRARTMQPIASGFQVAIDREVDIEHPAHYVIGVSDTGHGTFSGGGLHEVTGEMRNGTLRIGAAPKVFDIEVAFPGGSGSTSALIYRQCPRPQSVLLMVVQDPQNLSKGVDWLWAKSGKHATPQP